MYVLIDHVMMVDTVLEIGRSFNIPPQGQVLSKKEKIKIKE